MNNLDLTNQELHQLCQKALNNPRLSADEIYALLELSREDALHLFRTADSVRQREVGNTIHLRGLIEFSNICIRQCQYCGLMCFNKNVARYRMKMDEIVATAKAAYQMGYPSIVLQSGEDPYYNADRLAELMFRIKNETGLKAITLSAGEFTYDEYKKIQEAGADRYLLRFETSDEKIYRSLHPDSHLAERLECLESLREAGYQVGTGFMVGLPRETTQTLVDNLSLLQKLDVDMVGIGPFLANPDTPLKGALSGTVLATLKAVALTRILLPQANIPATTALGTLDKTGREKALQAGANVIMPNVSPMAFRELYKLYPDKMCVTADQGRAAATAMVHSLGREVALDPGHSFKVRNSQYAK